MLLRAMDQGVDDRLCRHRTGKQIALQGQLATLGQEMLLGLCFDTLGNNGQTKMAGNGNNGVDQCAIDFVAGQVAHKALVYLQLV